MMGPIVLGRALTTFTDSAIHTVGSLFTDYSTGKSYRYVKAGADLTGDALAAKNVVSFLTQSTANTADFVVTNKSANVNTTAGVAISAIPEGYYGWIQCGGECVVVGDGSVGFGETVVNNGDGTVDTMGTAEEAATVGVALTDDVATTYFVSIMLKGLM